MDKIGVIHGRFQVLHNDHMKYLLEGKKRCEHLIIGICNPEVDLTKYTEANPHRSKKSSNPLTFYERAMCIKNAMIEFGIKREEFDIVPFPINFPEKIYNYVPLDAKFYITIYDEWGKEKYKILKDSLNLDIEVLREVTLAEKGISASDIRKNIQEGKNWRDMVPNSVYEYIVQNKLDKRIREFLNEEE